MIFPIASAKSAFSGRLRFDLHRTRGARDSLFVCRHARGVLARDRNDYIGLQPAAKTGFHRSPKIQAVGASERLNEYQAIRWRMSCSPLLLARA
jgi:hypothetical protein